MEDTWILPKQYTTNGWKIRDTWTVRDLMEVLIQYQMDTEIYILDETKEDHYNIKEIADERSTMPKPNIPNALFLII
jgi:hypothetical protein